MRNIFYLLSFLTLCVFTSSIDHRKAEIKVEYNTSDNYYYNINQYLNFYPEIPIEYQDHESKQFRRDLKKWWPRLAPSGDITAANVAINEYNCNYQYQPSPYKPKWMCVGPTGKPEGASYTGNGQMHRITFDPNYDGVTNHTMYAVSNFGGVWKSSTKKIKWSNLNTDLFLPFTTVADIDVHPINTDFLLIATGDGDYGQIKNYTYSQIGGIKIGPTQTSGVYRSLNGGTTWEKLNGLNNSFCNNFNQGGNTRKIMINPNYPDQAFIATTKGIFKSNNITASPDEVQWKNVIAKNDETEYRGLAIKPDGTGRTIYASGSDIYKSADGGDTWQSMTTQSGQSFNGLDINNMPYGIKNCRINITTTPADPDRLYAHIFGFNDDLTCEECKDKCGKVSHCVFSCAYIKSWSWIYMFKDHKWHKIKETNSCRVIGSSSRRWVGIAASPINPNNVFYGTTNIVGNDGETTYEELLSGESFHDMSGYNSKGVHADIHCLKFEPENLSQRHPKLFATTHGGISINKYNLKKEDYKKFGTEKKIMRVMRSKFKKNWNRADDGLAVATMNDMDQSYLHPEQIIVALQDNGVVMHKDATLSDTSRWKNILGGDGYATMFDPNTNSAYIDNGQIYRYAYESNTKIKESQFMPIDPKDKFKSYARKFISRPHPQSGKMLTAFGELYERQINNPTKKSSKDDIWKLKSDVGKAIGAGWERNITDFKISESHPEYIYVVSSGVEGQGSEDFYMKSRIFRTTTGGCDGIQDYGDAEDALSCFDLISTEKIPAVLTGQKKLPFMKSVAIHPTNPNIIWVAFSGYDPNIKVLKWEYNPETGKGTWTNTDPHNTLNNLPVNHIVHQKGTDNRLYIGTDAGVWIKDENKDTWESYGDFPRVRVTAFRANYCDHSLIVGTWGRSVWTGNMLPMTSDYKNSVTINSGQQIFWTQDRAIDKNILIKKGGTLKIDSATISMAHNSKISVEPGGVLWLKQATLKNNCNQPWQGVEIIENNVINKKGILINDRSKIEQ